MATPTFLSVLGRDKLVSLFRAALEDVQDFSPVEREALETSVLDFLARNPGPLAHLLNNSIFTERYCALTRDLLSRAHDLAIGRDEREWVQQQAIRLGQKDLFTCCEEPLHLTGSQSAALAELRAIARLFFRAGHPGPVKPRLVPLIIGPTGVGKSYLGKQLARELGLEYLRVTVTSWVPRGARAEPQTLRVIQESLKRGKPILIHLDELCKLNPANTDAYTHAQTVEVFNVIDRTEQGTWSAEEQRRFATSAFIVGSGTWQGVWHERARTRMGFAASMPEQDSMIDEIRAARLIPTELLNRFSPPLFLEPFRAEDFKRLACQLNLPSDLVNPEDAARSGLNMRYIENAVAEVALREVRHELHRESTGSQLCPDRCR